MIDINAFFLNLNLSFKLFLIFVVKGLKTLHDLKIVNRDLKCANVFISGGLYKIGDLNVSKVATKGLV